MGPNISGRYRVGVQKTKDVYKRKQKECSQGVGIWAREAACGRYF